ncbi:hypothetical protein OBBRIDRAFT_803571 [Obba rivulosa]|uniref:Myb/SANT-like domain-containing protein n=1 Tax=Obba rivulosa TaxID=1052685 RepID=A0A8E2B3X6_9APHY|nr:hypothetical protein OBBRIDRAFT_803571 [Obba rivulosa]
MEYLVDHQGEFGDGEAKSTVWEGVAKSLRRAFPKAKGALKIAKSCHGKYTKIKGKFRVVRQIKDASGFGKWDVERGADVGEAEEETWNDFEKTVKGAKEFKNSGFRHEDTMRKLDTTEVSGKQAYNPNARDKGKIRSAIPPSAESTNSARPVSSIGEEPLSSPAVSASLNTSVSQLPTMVTSPPIGNTLATLLSTEASALAALVASVAVVGPLTAPVPRTKSVAVTTGRKRADASSSTASASLAPSDSASNRRRTGSSVSTPTTFAGAFTINRENELKERLAQTKKGLKELGLVVEPRLARYSSFWLM